MLDCKNITEIEIIKKINSWDIDAYFCIVENYKNKILNYILRITDIWIEESENLLQETFIKAYENINSYNEKYTFSNWLYRIAHNLVIDFHRKNEKKETISLETKDEEYRNLIEIIPNDFDIEKNISDRELSSKIKKILSKIDIKYKEVLVLKFIEEKDYNEISDILKIPPWTVWTLINRAKTSFKQKAIDCNLSNYL